MRTAAVACLLALPTLSLLPGCIFRQLGRDLEQIEEAGTIEIHIDGARGDGSPVVAVLIEDHAVDGGPAIVDAFGVASSKGDITLFCWPGEYLVMAFEDTNHSGHYEQGEPYAYHDRRALGWLGQQRPGQAWRQARRASIAVCPGR